MTISEIPPGFQNITNQSKISSDQHFSILLDSDGFVGLDENTIKTTRNASYPLTHDQSHIQVVFDTVFSYSSCPSERLFPTFFSASPNGECATCNRYVVNVICSCAPGAQLVRDI